MIQYIGWLQHSERDDKGKLVAKYFTIVLELADFDLNWAFRGQASPTQPNEIEGFWVSMLDVAVALDSIHDGVSKDEIDYDLYVP